jgi:uncharacterized protein
MVKVSVVGSDVDRCTLCHGIFFEGAERDAKLGTEDEGIFDDGDSNSGVRSTRVSLLLCPGCGSQMVRVVDLEYCHICFEHCTGCAGIFLDGGRFNDLTHDTAVDLFKDLQDPRRRQLRWSDETAHAIASRESRRSELRDRGWIL